MALIAERWGLIPELQSFAKQGRPIWGTCAGLIFLADKAIGALSASCRDPSAASELLSCVAGLRALGSAGRSTAVTTNMPVALGPWGHDMSIAICLGS